ncbi:hypothetical protein CFN78_26635 [Amycolatopsis antarctica]|uniref:Heavy metal-binding domain-containing protein n=1 Tax=Amycolatopsis antarctica TaxID=1854586 RepID=A0A263CVI9_9PSEU|nr:hypothetical protein [Amycolatopsis antarctica]OZM70152.1 hypothetical protein CFN78_26635 [Amycolatopsis antarctica]
MNVPTRLAAYGAVLVLAAGGAWAVGTAVGPLGAAADGGTGAHGEQAVHGTDAGHGDTHGDVSGAAAEAPGGLVSTAAGYTLVPLATTVAAGPEQPFSFRVTGPDGRPVTAYEVEHEKPLHLIVVRRDTSAFQHVHPELGPDGTWTVPLDTTAPGSYRVFADFVPSGGPALTLGTDLSVAGEFTPVTHAESRDTTVDGYRVWLDGDLTPGRTSRLTLAVARDGEPVTDLQPYLGAYGHLVALRAGDLAYLHVHPDGEPGDGRTAPGPTVTFFAEVPTAGTYRMFLDFQHEGTVRTAEFTVGTAPAAATHPPGAPEPAHGHGPADE